MSWFIWTIILITAPWFFSYLLWRARFKIKLEKEAPILVFHGVADGFDWSITNQNIQQFKRKIKFLYDQGFGSTNLVAADHQKGVQKGKEIIITFDDAFEDIYFKAFPILKEFGFTAYVFVITGYVGRFNDWDYGWGKHRKRHLSWQQIEEMVETGFVFGSHTVNHPDLTRIPRRLIRYELEKSKETLEQRLGKRIDFLSYPFGRYDRYVEKEAERAGYKSAYTMSPVISQNPNSFSRSRKGVYLIDSPLTLRIKLYTNKLVWIEEMKGRIINQFSDWTVALKGSPNYDRLPEDSIDG